MTRLSVRAWLGAMLAIAAGSACYSPELHDCTVSCASADDCAGDQVCGTDRLCAMPGVAGKCAELAVTVDGGVAGDGGIARPDAGTPPRDAGTPDSPPAPTTIALRVQIDGKGAVFVNGHGSCSDRAPQKGDCTFMIAPNVAQTVSVLPDLGQKFIEWTSTTCRGAPAMCTFTPTAALVLSVKFDKLGGGPGRP